MNSRRPLFLPLWIAIPQQTLTNTLPPLLRLLAHAGFDPRRAVRFWEDRAEVLQGSECVASAAFGRERREHQRSQSTFALRIVGSSHPVNEVRVEKLREELHRWRTERERVLTEMQTR